MSDKPLLDDVREKLRTFDGAPPGEAHGVHSTFATYFRVEELVSRIEVLEQAQLSDIERVMAMLNRANIPYEHDRVSRGDDWFPRTDGLPDTIQRLNLNPPENEAGTGYKHQPFDGGYMGFYAELVFDVDGALIAIWAWE
jgi:hypothetical protein